MIPARIQFKHILVMGMLGGLIVCAAGVVMISNARKQHIAEQRLAEPRVSYRGTITGWWDAVPEAVKTASAREPGDQNISRSAYAGHTSCKSCHKRNYEQWSKHPHRWMNAMADESTVLGDFSGAAGISYLGGTARFYREHDGFRMELKRDGIQRVYQINQTIGSRFFQYYVGQGLQGPEPEGHEFYTVDHVLPFGYWLDQQEWVPTVHVHWVMLAGEQVDEEDVPGDQRPDPFDAREGSIAFTPYYHCNYCHTTFPLGDLMVRNPDVVGRHAPRNMHLTVPEFLAEAHPKLWDGTRPAHELSDAEFKQIKQAIHRFEAPQHAVSLGITCEACHLGSRAHAEGKLKKPAFFPRSPHLLVESVGGNLDFGRTQSNVNWACGRCHSGNRRQLAGGMATWNSTEYTDAMRGSCYSQLKCIDCHDPHRATGKRWEPSLAQTDSICLKCHQDYQQPEQRMAHTHHAPGSTGSSCLNCHMPHINEGLQDVVRTHMIFSPTEPRMIESNQPNACNQCHTDQGIDWTLKHLRDWYHKEYPEPAIAAGYSDRERSVAVGWLHSDDQSVRLLGADALFRTQSRWALAELIEVLDDPFLMNRQFGRIGLESMLGVKLSDFGYQFYMTTDERREPLQKIREALLKPVSSNVHPAQNSKPSGGEGPSLETTR